MLGLFDSDVCDAMEDMALDASLKDTPILKAILPAKRRPEDNCGGLGEEFVAASIR